MERKFTGRIGRTVAETQYEYEDIPGVIGENAPNVVYIVLDDLGFAQLGCYGSNIDTPNINSIAGDGLRYNNFHTTAICSATRASLLTGANHHSVGINATVEMVTGCNNGTGEISPSYATLAEMLKEYGYATFACGKWHLTPRGEVREAGPYQNWPLGKGFDRYYGFLAANNNQFYPTLTNDNTMVEQPQLPNEGYHFSEDITNKAIHYVSTHKNAYPDKPFFLYLAYGAMHTPHQAPKRYIEKYKGRFDAGWDVLRKEWFDNQKKLGIIPKDARLNPRNSHAAEWESLSKEQKLVYARYMEAFAGMLEHTDDQIGRLVDYLKKINQYDNTIIVLLSDNGASSEGGPNGRLNMHNGGNTVSVTDTIDEMLEYIDLIGGEYTQNSYPLGWGNLGNTPFQWYKTWAHGGGIRDPLIISYPNVIKQSGEIRGQYHHVIDITPTILDLIGVKKPEYIKGIHQEPVQGISMKYTFDDKDAVGRRTTQYYEMLGNRAIYRDGWKAVVDHTWNSSYEEDVWELYNLESDFSESINLADKYPEKLAELKELWVIEASRYGVFPMHNNSCTGKPRAYSLESGIQIPEKTYEFHYIDKYYELVESPFVTENSFYIVIRMNRSSKDEQGVLYSFGDRFGGFSLYVKNNILKFAFNHSGKKVTTINSEQQLPVGDVTVRLEVQREDGTYAKVRLYVDEKLVKSAILNDYVSEELMGNMYHIIGADRQVAVTDDYVSPYIFEGEIIYAKIHTAGTETTMDRLLKDFFNED